jgi:hypothetical protein
MIGFRLRNFAIRNFTTYAWQISTPFGSTRGRTRWEYSMECCAQGFQSEYLAEPPKLGG